ncbi:unnamed protein product [Brassica oleracea var. botrytis]|uniref:Uncharacterized protein n=1 Tax=Brassica oleracea TaxID=3712 RepID=A0A3P6BYG3_BRAOL|nr:unnamed protein product [Brassica oleracea]
MRQSFGEHVHTLHSTVIGNFPPESRRGTYSFSGRAVYASFTSLVLSRREFVIEFLPDAFILRWVKTEEEERKKLSWKEYSDALAEVEEKMIKEEEAQQEEDDAQLNEAGESEEEDDPPMNESGGRTRLLS